MAAACKCDPRGCFAYVDESGHPHQLDFGPYVVAAVVIPGSCAGEVSRVLAEGTRRILEPISRALPWFPGDAEIHVSEIVQGTGVWRRVKVEEKQRVLDSYADLLAGLPISVVLVVVRRGLGSIVHSWRGIRVHAYKMLGERILMAPGKPPQRLVIVVDSSSPGIDEKVRADIELGLVSGYVEAGKTRVKVRFADSRMEPLLQAADFYAYMVREAEMHRYKVQRGRYIIDLEAPLLRALRKVRRCPETGAIEGCGIKRWVI